MPHAYPWYEIVRGSEVQQGDLLNNCSIAIPTFDNKGQGKISHEIKERQYDVIILSQSCDLVLHKIDLVLVCPHWSLDEHAAFKSPGAKENLRKGTIPGYHLLNKCAISGHKLDYQVVDFRSVYSLPFDFIVKLAEEESDRLRLLPPYREHLSQAFARFFMRVGLPVDIPAFKA